MASPAEVVRQLLMNAGLVVMPPASGSNIPCYVSSLPDEPDVLVFITGPAGRMFGRRMRDGKQLIHPGLSLSVRSLDYTGRTLAEQVAAALDAIYRQTVVCDDSTTHYVQSVYRTTPIVDAGEDVFKQRQLWTMNARIAFQDQETSIVG